MSVARTLGELRHSSFTAQRLGSRQVKDELRENLMLRLREGTAIFPGIVGYDDTVVPQIVNAILSRHNFILLGLRGQAKSRILRALTSLLDPQMPYVAGCEIHDNPYAPICRRCRELVAKEGDATPIAWLTPEHRYVEKLATPDVTIADLIGDIDPIKAARGGTSCRASSRCTMDCCRAPIAEFLRSTSCPILRARFRSDSSTSCRKAMCRLRISDPAAARCRDCVQRKSRGLHGAREDHHAAEGSHRIGNSHPLSGDGGRGHRDYRAGSLD